MLSQGGESHVAQIFVRRCLDQVSLHWLVGDSFAGHTDRMLGRLCIESVVLSGLIQKLWNIQALFK